MMINFIFQIIGFFDETINGCCCVLALYVSLLCVELNTGIVVCILYCLHVSLFPVIFSTDLGFVLTQQRYVIVIKTLLYNGCIYGQSP